MWALATAVLSGSTALVAARIRHRRQAHRFPVELDAHFTTAPGTLPLTPAAVTDINSYGLGFDSTLELTPGTWIGMMLVLDGTDIHLQGAVVRALRGTAVNTYGVVFETTAAVHDAIAAWCFRHPFGPEHVLLPVEAAETPVRIAG